MEPSTAIIDSIMANKRKKKNKKTVQLRPSLQPDQESPAADVVTVAWLLCIFTGLICDLGAAITRYYANVEQESLVMLSGLLFFAALAIGVLSLGLLPVVVRSRNTPPPKALLIGGVIIAVLPWLALIIQVLRG